MAALCAPLGQRPVSIPKRQLKFVLISDQQARHVELPAQRNGDICQVGAEV